MPFLLTYYAFSGILFLTVFEIKLKDVTILDAKTALNKSAVNTTRFLLGKIVLMYCHANIERYKPKHDAFILVANHSDALDVVYTLCSLKKYVRFVISDHLVNDKPIVNLILKKISGFIVRDRDKPSSVMIEDVIKSTKDGVSVGICVEGAITPNGETGFFSHRTGQLIKDSGVALITFKMTGGYFHTPKWGTGLRKGPVHGGVVREYSPEELQKMTVEEINEAIRKDIYVNAFDDQKRLGNKYTGKNLAEHVERVLFMCPHCMKVGTLHSSGDFLTCDCGYKVELRSDGFFYPVKKELIFDNILEWDKWQKETWKSYVLSVKSGDLVFEESGQRVATVVKRKRKSLSENATLKLYTDKFELVLNENETITIPLESIKLVLSVSVEALLIIDQNNYYYIRTHKPRATSKYVAAWRYLIGKDFE